MTTENVQAILDERGSRYGSFVDNARISHALYKLVVIEDENRTLMRKQEQLEPYQLEALKMVCHKIARILSGDPSYADNWDDIAGYAQLGKEPR